MDENSKAVGINFGMADQDLGAIFDYLQTLPPLKTVLLERAD